MLKKDDYKLSVIIAGAGSSERLCNKSVKSKQFLLLKDKPLLLYSVEKFLLLENLLEIIVITNDIDATRELIGKNKLDKNVEFKIVLGGKRRQDSVYNGFSNLNPLCDLVLIHDVGRPLFYIENVKQCIEKARETNAAILAIPTVDTLKKAKSDNDELIVDKTIDRDHIYSVQTPQVFSYDMLASVYNLCKNDMEQITFTDEASMVELFKKPVNLVIGDRRNIKITYPEDLCLAHAILNNELEIESERIPA